MRIVLFLLVSGFIVACGAQAPRVDGPSSVVITAPQSGQLLQGNVVHVYYQLTRGRADGGDHVHVWLDGENYGFSFGPPKKLPGVQAGEHTVLVRVAREDHKFPGPEAVVTFRVE
jgi:hypothetical protein